MADASGRSIMRRTWALVGVLCVAVLIGYGVFVGWAVQETRGAVRWLLVLLPPAAGGLAGHWWYRSFRTWVDE